MEYARSAIEIVVNAIPFSLSLSKGSPSLDQMYAGMMSDT